MDVQVLRKWEPTQKLASECGMGLRLAGEGIDIVDDKAVCRFSASSVDEALAFLRGYKEGMKAAGNGAADKSVVQRGPVVVCFNRRPGNTCLSCYHSRPHYRNDRDCRLNFCSLSATEKAECVEEGR